MYRQRLHINVTNLEGWNTVLDVTKEVNTIAKRNKLPQAKAWTLTVGIFNELIIETDYPSMADFEKAQKVMFGDPEMVKQIMRVNEVAVPGKGWSELLEHAEAVG